MEKPISKVEEKTMFAVISNPSDFVEDVRESMSCAVLVVKGVYLASIEVPAEMQGKDFYLHFNVYWESLNNCHP